MKLFLRLSFIFLSFSLYSNELVKNLAPSGFIEKDFLKNIKKVRTDKRYTILYFSSIDNSLFGNLVKKYILEEKEKWHNFLKTFLIVPIHCNLTKSLPKEDEKRKKKDKKEKKKSPSSDSKFLKLFNEKFYSFTFPKFYYSFATKDSLKIKLRKNVKDLNSFLFSLKRIFLDKKKKSLLQQLTKKKKEKIEEILNSLQKKTRRK